jgi:hypothetical protein
MGDHGLRVQVDRRFLHNFDEARSVQLIKSTELVGYLSKTFAEQAIAAEAAAAAAFLGKDFLGNQLTQAASLPMPGLAGKQFWYADFENGTIYWVEGHGAFILSREIRDKWNSLGGAAGFLGMPLIASHQAQASGTAVDFEGGSIYFTAETGAHEVHGDIRIKWLSVGGHLKFGYPITDELPTPNGRGKLNHFANGSVYWTPEIGAYEVHGDIRDRWASLGWENSYLGFPVSDQFETPEGAAALFERGRLDSVLASNTVVETPNRIVVDSGKLGPNTTTGSATLALLSNGYWGFKGYVRESGAIGHNYKFMFYSHVLDASAHAIGTSHNGEVHGLVGGDREQSWEDTGWSQSIIDNWDDLSVKGFSAELRVNTLGSDIGELIAIGAFVVPIAILGGQAASGKKVTCAPGIYRDDSGGAGAGVTCTVDDD